MLQTTFIKVRTLSFAFAMMAMLGVGTLIPVHQAAAQDLTTEQRAAMLVQINQLMQLITQLMAQMQLMQAEGVSSEIERAELPVIFTHPSKKQYEAGGTLDVKWTKDDGWYTGLKIENQETGKVNFFRDALSADRLYQLKAPTEPGEYRLIAYNYRGIADSDDYVEYGVSRPFTVVADKNTEAQKELQRVIDELNSIGKKDKDDIEDDINDLREDLEEYEERYEDVYQEAREYDLDDVIEELIEKIEWYLDEAEEQYEDEDYDFATDNLSEAEDLLDELNDVLDDIEDGRLNNQSSDDLQDMINDLLNQVAGQVDYDASISVQNLSDLGVRVSYVLTPTCDPTEAKFFDLFTGDGESYKIDCKGILNHYYDETGSYLITIKDGGKTIGSKQIHISAAVKADTPPGSNAFGCDRTFESYGNGKLACYGMWDYGQSFGGDVNMCNSYSGGTGCEIKAPVCESGKAIATDYYSNRDLRGKSNAALSTIANNLQVTTNVVREEVAGLWSYECVGDKEVSSKNSQPERLSRAIVIGAYEGTLADGTSRGFQEHPQGEVEVYLATDDYTSGVLLVLTAYEPVKWNITGPGAEDVVAKVWLSGYYDQEVSGISSDVPVTMTSHESGDRNYMYTYESDSRNYDALEDYIRDEYDVSITQFNGAYKQDVVRVLGYKG